MAAPNVGLLGSHGAAAIPLLATILAWGRSGIAELVELCMASAARLAQFIASEPRLELLMEPQTGIVVWRPKEPACIGKIQKELPPYAVSMTRIEEQNWFRNVAANPNADVGGIAEMIDSALDNANTSR